MADTDKDEGSNTAAEVALAISDALADTLVNRPQGRMTERERRNAEIQQRLDAALRKMQLEKQREELSAMPRTRELSEQQTQAEIARSKAATAESAANLKAKELATAVEGRNAEIAKRAEEIAAKYTQISRGNIESSIKAIMSQPESEDPVESVARITAAKGLEARLKSRAETRKAVGEAEYQPEKQRLESSKTRAEIAESGSRVGVNQAQTRLTEARTAEVQEKTVLLQQRQKEMDPQKFALYSRVLTEGLAVKFNPVTGEPMQLTLQQADERARKAVAGAASAAPPIDVTRPMTGHESKRFPPDVGIGTDKDTGVRGLYRHNKDGTTTYVGPVPDGM